MVGTFTTFKRLAFYSRVTAIYAVTLCVGWYAMHPGIFEAQAKPVALTRQEQRPHQPTKPEVVTISGKPVRLVIPASGIDLPVDEGYYNQNDGSWTLSGYHAQFAMASTLANNIAGDTFIYGHNNNSVFGALRHNTPIEGAEALIYTDNGKIFHYRFTSAREVTPDDVSALDYQGPPVLTIQTCTGSLNEWRTFYRFAFERVE